MRLRSGFAGLKQELKKVRRKKRTVSLNDAENIGILVPIKNEKELSEVMQFANTLEVIDKKVRLLGFLLDDSLRDKVDKNIHVISKEDIKWNYIPNTEKIREFINNEFDILIHLCTELCFPLLYTAAMSKSVFKVAAYDNRRMPFFDLMIETNEESITGFSRQIRYYLDKIK